MKYILTLLMLTGVLFSAQQKQIIIGSFSKESNALFYSLDVQKKIDADEKLQALMQKYGFKLEYNKVGNYHVVRLYPFDNYPSLVVTINKFQEYYPEAYAIRYPAFVTSKSIPKVVKQTVIEKESMNDAEDDDTQMETAVLDVEAPEPENIKIPEADLKYEPQKVQKQVAPVVIPTPIVVEEASFAMTDILLVVALLLVLIAFIIYKIKMKKKEED